MSFFLARFTKRLPLNELVEQLEVVECFQVLGDWYEHRLSAVYQAGLDSSSAPAQTIERARARRGEAKHVTLTIETGDLLSGQITGDGLLLGNRNIEIALADDMSLRSFVQKLESIVGQLEIELG